MSLVVIGMGAFMSIQATEVRTPNIMVNITLNMAKIILSPSVCQNLRKFPDFQAPRISLTQSLKYDGYVKQHRWLH